MIKTILVVDDSISARKLLEGLLVEEGYKVILAESATETFKILEKLRPDLILLDIHLGDNNGIEVCRYIKSTPKINDIPVILISGTANAEEWAMGLKLGASDCVLKPFNSMELIARIHAQITLSETDQKLKETQVDLQTAKEKGEENEKILLAIFENSQDAIAITQNGKHIMLNQTFLDLLGYDNQNELIGKSFLEHISPKELDRIKDFHKKRTLGLEVLRFYETIGIRKNGEEFPFDVKVGNFTVNNQIFSIAIVRDISDRKKVEKELEQHRNKLEELVQERTLDLVETIQRLKDTQAQLIQSEKLASLGTLTAGIAHEINNPINYIHSSIQALSPTISELIEIVKIYEMINENNIHQKKEELKLIKEKLQINEIAEEFYLLSQNIIEGSMKISEIIKSLNNFSNNNSGVFSLSDLNEEINSTLLLLHSQYTERIQVIKELESIPPIKCIQGRLNQVFMNLFINAIQSIEKEGEIFIKTKYLQEGNPIFKQESIFISIKDSGCGIPMEMQNKIFEPFFTTKDTGKGRGLGLPISYGIIEQHKGKIEFTSEINKGTEFRIYLPLS